jgi:hypothetical protein
MCYWVLPVSGISITRSTVQNISEDQKSVDAVKEELQALDAAILQKYQDEHFNAEVDYNHLRDDDDVYSTDCITPAFEPVEPEASMTEADEFDTEAYDQYINAQGILTKGDECLLGTVVQ